MCLVNNIQKGFIDAKAEGGGTVIKFQPLSQHLSKHKSPWVVFAGDGWTPVAPNWNMLKRLGRWVHPHSTTLKEECISHTNTPDMDVMFQGPLLIFFTPSQEK